MTTIESLRPDDWHAVIACALARLPEEQRAERMQHIYEMLKAGRLDPRGIFVARVDGVIAGVQVCVPLAGAACLFWVPSTADACGDALVSAALAWSRQQGCKVAQALAHPDERDLTAPLQRQGFRPITQLHQLTHDLVDLPPVPESRLRIVPYDASLATAFAATLDRSYTGTLDCPELNGVRAIEEILAGHRAQGKFDPALWWLAYEGTAPVGVVMLVELSDAATWELAYVGVVPEARRRRHGRDLIVQAMHALSRRAALALTLAVDGRNAPARTLYQTLGFVEVECSDVLLHIFV